MEISGKAVLYLLLAVAPGFGEAIQSEFPNGNWAALHAHGYAAFGGGRYADALADFESSLPLASSPEQRAITLSDIGNTLVELDRAAEALAQLEQALSLWRSISTARDRALQVAVTVGILQRTLGRFHEAEQTLRAAADSASRGNSGSAIALIAFGDLLNEQGRFIEACQTYEEALKLSPARDRTRASALISLGYAESNARQFQPAFAQLREALAVSKEINAPQLEALALRDLGNTYAQTGDFAGAQVMLRRALAIFETTPIMRVQYAGTLVSLGVVYGAENKSGLAEDVFVRALEIYDRTAGGPTIRAVALQNMAMLRARQKRFSEAADFANRAYTALKSAVGENSAPAANALGTLAFVEGEAGDLERSDRDYSDALRILGDDHLLDSNSALGIMSGYESVLRKLHHKREAKAMEQRLKALRAARPQ
jgi:tetratricopeptide (TPR) repeat protein